MAKNPLRFSDIDINNHNIYAAPRNPLYPLDEFSGYEPSPTEPHNAGEVWCVALWEARANLIAKYGFQEGNELMLRLVTDGLNLCGSQNPNYLQARDAILLADRIYTKGANQMELWRGFAKRGMGLSAVCPASTSNSGIVDAFDLPAPSTEFDWAHFTPSEIYSSPAVAADGTVYYGANDKTVRAINADGSLKWTFSVTGSPGAFQSSPAIGANGTVYIGCNDSYLYALNGSTGALIWKFKTGFEVFSSPAVGPDGSVYFGSIDGKVYALPPGYSQGGATKWVVQTGNTVYSSASVSADGWVYIGSSDNKVYALSAANGSSKAGWPFVTAGLVASSPALASDGSVYIGSYDGKVYAINPNGTAKWATPFATGGAVRSAPAIGPGGTVIYVGSQDRKLYALNAATGTRIWDYTTGLDVDSSPAVAANGTVIFGSNDNVVYALNSNGGFLWQLPALGKVFGSACIASDGRIYIASAGADRANLYALSKGLTGPASSSWPMFRKNIRRTGY
jgi:outer membrane protein assembly factor BamB